MSSFTSVRSGLYSRITVRFQGVFRKKKSIAWPLMSLDSLVLKAFNFIIEVVAFLLTHKIQTFKSLKLNHGL